MSILAYLQTAVLLYVLTSIVTALVLRFKHRNTFLVNNANSEGTSSATISSSPSPRRIGLIIAHPDDESMFFLPTLQHIQSLGSSVATLSILCLSTGNADGLGDTRVKELQAVADRLGMTTKIHQIDDEHLQDGMRTHWKIERIVAHIDQFVREERLDTLITFDRDGISQHPNHVDTFRGIRMFFARQNDGGSSGSASTASSSSQPVIGYSLVSTPIYRKYLGVLDGLLAWYEEHSAASVAASASSKRATVSRVKAKQSEYHVITLIDPLLNYQCMSLHHSQFVWYRKLFVLFSRYSFVNTLVRIR